MSNLVTDILLPKTGLKLHVGLFFGTFNPIHSGHMVIANYLVEFTEINQLWFVVSPQSPFKKKNNLLDDFQRLELVHRAIGNDSRFRASNTEFNLPKPSYTIDTLTYLKEQYPDYRFSLIMGSDNLENFHKWKNYKTIIENYGIIVYPRPGFDRKKVISFKNITITDAPLIEISSTFIRKAIADGKDIRHFLPPKSWEYLDEMNFYKK
ncbi:MAG: nicotinate-nucleotide adenylyltransferase [Prolixibacteraceae bacterium]|nr:nicotinate-nucleotide adenylyltransferase [Prolixibacteraceae bacterium]